MISRNSVVKNSFWFGLETIVDAFVSLALSIAAARVIGPVRLGYFIYTMFLVNLAGRLGAFGPGAAARKFLAEYLGREDRATARTVFFIMLRWHVQLGFLFAAAGWVLIFTLEDPLHRLVSSILVVSLLAAIINIVASQTNMAAENFARNVPASLISLAVYAATVILTLTLGWGVTGLAIAVMLRRTIEMLMRLVPAVQWARQLPVAPAPPQLTRQLLAFSGQGLAIAGLLLIVWDRSELVFLRHFCKIQEVTFYSVAFSVTEMLIMLPNVFGAAVTSKFMAIFGRPAGDVRPLVSSSCRYLAILIFPMYVGLAALSDPFIRVFYGHSYVPAIPVMALSLVLVMPKAFYWLPSSALQAADRQGLMFRWMLGVAALNVTLDALLIPRFGAIGAALANGIAQPVAVIALCFVAERVCGFKLPWAAMGGTLCTSLAMGAVVYFAGHYLPPAVTLFAGPVLGALVYVLLLRLSNAFNEEDLVFARQFEERIPVRLRGACMTLLEWITGASRFTPASSLVASEANARNS